MRVMRTVAALLATLAAGAQAQVIVTRGGPGGPGGGGERRITMGGTQPVFEESPGEYGVRGWQVGQWVRYSIAVNMGGQPINQYRQVSVVGRQGERFWVETQDEFGGMMGSRGPVSKMLIPFGVVRERVGTDVYTMSPDSAVSRRTLLRQGSGGSGSGINFPAGWQRVGEEQVTVAGGAFRAVKYTRGSEILWVSADAGPLGVVKYESDQLVIELIGKGDNARSRIPYGG